MIKLILLLIFVLNLYATQTMHPRTYEAIDEANRYIEQKKYKKADELFKNLLERTSKRRVYDHAFIHNAIAYLNIQSSNYKEAIKSYNKALSFSVLPQTMRDNIIYSLAQLSIEEQEYKDSIEYLNEWHKTKDITFDSSKLMMVNYLSIEDNKEALVWCKKAITLSKKPTLELYQNQLALQISLELVDQSIKSLEFMIETFKVKKSYFKQLSYLYQSAGDDNKSVAILESAYQLGLLKSYSEKLQLAQMLNYIEATQKAIQVVQTLRDDTNNTAKTLEYLAQLQLSSKEYDKAIHNLKKLYESTKKKKTALLLAQLFASQAKWKECETYARYFHSAESKMLLAVALAEQKKYAEAGEIFTSLLKEKEFKLQAKMWLEHIK